MRPTWAPLRIVSCLSIPTPRCVSLAPRPYCGTGVALAPADPLPCVQSSPGSTSSLQRPPSGRSLGPPSSPPAPRTSSPRPGRPLARRWKTRSIAARLWPLAPGAKPRRPLRPPLARALPPSTSRQRGSRRSADCRTRLRSNRTGRARPLRRCQHGTRPWQGGELAAAPVWRAGLNCRGCFVHLTPLSSPVAHRRSKLPKPVQTGKQHTPPTKGPVSATMSEPRTAYSELQGTS